MADFLKQYPAYFKRLWTIPWFYLLMTLLAMGGRSLEMKIVLGVATILLTPLLGMAYNRAMKHIEQTEKPKK